MILASFSCETTPALEDAHANCFCASLLRTKFTRQRHASSERAKW